MENIQYELKRGSKMLIPVYNGKIIDTMPKLIESGQTPLLIKDIMEQRVNTWNSNDIELAKHWGNNYFDSGDTIIYHPDGRIKFVSNSKTLKTVNSNSSFKWYGSQVLEDGTFDNIEGTEFSREQIGKFGNKKLTKSQAPKNDFWLALVQDDKTLLKEYVGQVYSRLNKKELMPIWISKEKPDFESERIFCFMGIEYSSYIVGNSIGQFENLTGRLVGMQGCSKISQQPTLINLEDLVADISRERENGPISYVIENSTI